MAATAPRTPGRIRLRRKRAGVVGHPLRRARGLYLSALFIFTIFAAQLVRVQAFDAASVQQAALDKRLQTVVVPAVRGRILDAKGQVLAASVERRIVTVNQNAVKEYTRTIDKKLVKVGVVGAAQRLAPLLGTTPEALLPDLLGTSYYRIIARNVAPTVWREIEGMGIPGIASEVTYQRDYPAGETSAPIVGFVTSSEADTLKGNAGIEQMTEKQLAGTPGSVVYEQARDGKEIPWAIRPGVEAVDGLDVTLTIDSDLQWTAQHLIAEQVAKTGSISGYVVVMEAKTGKLRAVASAPSFDPTQVGKAKASQLRSAAFQDLYEPGSTAKVMSMAAALEEGLVTPATGVVVPNRLRRADRTFKDFADHPTQNLTVAGVLAKSSNIGTILSTEAVPPATMERYYRAFGLGSPSAVGFPAEPTGGVTPAAQLSGSQRYTQLFGQGISLSAIQATSVFQTIANKGVRMPATLIEGTSEPGRPVAPQALPEGQRVVSEKTATELSQMLEGVTGTGGTATKVVIPGYRVAGKTGTAYRYEDRLADYSGYTTSFIGFAPADDPQFVVAVTLQKPALDNPSGSGLCGPIFTEVMSYALQSYQVPPTGTTAPGLPLTFDGSTQGAAGVISDSKPNG
jgi:cell division protein FtsI (penicillin-binding protein 3)